MTDPARELLEQALKLTPDDRLRLADAIYESVHGDEGVDDPAEVEAAWAAEIERRVRDMPPPGAPLPTTDEVFARVRARLEELRRAR